MEKPKPRIVHDGPDFVIIDKPPLLDSQNSKDSRYSVVDWLTEKFRFAGLVHRLDFGTSGLMVCAKNPAAAQRLTDAMEAGKIARGYQAVVMGRDLPNSGTFRDPIENQDAITHYKVLKRFVNACLVEVDLETGRKHQIRIHFSNAGHSLLGDHLHGKKGAKLLFHRPALHACKLTVEGRTYTCQVPADMEKLIQTLPR